VSLHIFLCAYCKAHTQHSSLCHGYTVAVTWPTAQGGQSKQKVPTNSSMAQAQQSGIAWKVHVRPQSATSQCDTVQGCKGWAAVAGREARASASSRMVRPGSPLLDVSTDQSPTAPMPYLQPPLDDLLQHRPTGMCCRFTAEQMVAAEPRDCQPCSCTSTSKSGKPAMWSASWAS